MGDAEFTAEGLPQIRLAAAGGMFIFGAGGLRYKAPRGHELRGKPAAAKLAEALSSGDRELRDAAQRLNCTLSSWCWEASAALGIPLAASLAPVLIDSDQQTVEILERARKPRPNPKPDTGTLRPADTLQPIRELVSCQVEALGFSLLMAAQ